MPKRVLWLSSSNLFGAQIEAGRLLGRGSGRQKYRLASCEAYLLLRLQRGSVPRPEPWGSLPSPRGRTSCESYPTRRRGGGGVGALPFSAPQRIWQAMPNCPYTRESEGIRRPRRQTKRGGHLKPSPPVLTDKGAVPIWCRAGARLPGIGRGDTPWSHRTPLSRNLRGDRQRRGCVEGRIDGRGYCKGRLKSPSVPNGSWQRCIGRGRWSLLRKVHQPHHRPKLPYRPYSAKVRHE